MTDEEFFKLRARAGAYAEWYDRDRVSSYASDLCPEEVRRNMVQADRLIDQIFTFEDRWDMEPCQEPCTLKKMVWDSSPNGDPEWIFMLNRHEYLNKLLLAYWFTGRRDYVDKLKWYLLHWIRNNPIVPEGTVSTRTIDTGIRCMSWQYLLLHLIGEGIIDRQDAETILDSMSCQFRNMKQRYIGKYALSNWGVLQTTAICHGYLWFAECLPPDGMEDWAWQELENQIGLQVLDDGSHWEQSIMYHIEVLLACMKLLASLRAVNRSGEMHGEEKQRRTAPCRDVSWLEEAVYKMSHYVLYAAGPDHCQIAQCDSDVTDVRDVMVKAAVISGDRRYKYAGYDHPDLDSAWLLGAAGISAYGQMKALKPDGLSLAAADSGNIYFRSSWEKDSHFTYLKCGPLGSGHGHADLTHISLYYRGVPVLADSGRYTYVEEEPLRPFLKSAQAHNVCVIDGMSHARPRGSWGYDSFPHTIKNYYRQQGPVHYAEMGYYDSLPSGENYLVIRKVMAVDQGIWLIVNDIRCGGKHEVKEYYHLDSCIKSVRMEQQTDFLYPLWLGLNGERAGDTNRRTDTPGQCLQLMLYSPGPFKAVPSVMSRRYNQKEESTCLVKEAGFTDRFTDWSCLTGEDSRAEKCRVYQYGSRQPETQEQVTAVRVIRSSDEYWDLLVWNQETWQGGKVHYCQGVPVYAKAAAIHTMNGNTTLYRLRI